MAEDTSRLLNTSQEKNARLVAFLNDIEKEWKSGKYNNLGIVVSLLLRKAGLDYHGLDAVELHMNIFVHVFGIFRKDCHFEFTVDDYFTLLCNKELKWTAFFLNLIPWLSLNVACVVLEKAINCVQRMKDSQDNSLLILYFALTLMYSIILDFLADNPESHKPEEYGELTESKNTLFESQGTSGKLKKLASLMTTCVEGMVNVLKNYDERLGHGTEWYLKSYAELLPLIILILNPFSTAQETGKVLRSVYVGKYYAPFKKNTWLNDKPNRSDAWKNWCQLDCEPVMSEVSLPKKLQERSQEGHKLEVDVCSGDNENKNSKDSPIASGLGKLNITSLPVIASIGVVDRLKLNAFSHLLTSIKSHTPPKLYHDLIMFYCQGHDLSRYIANEFKALSQGGKDVRIADHLISGKKYFLEGEKLLQSFSDGSALQLKNAQLWRQFSDFCNGSVYKFLLDFENLQKQDGIERHSHQNPHRDGLVILTKIVKNKGVNWRELLAGGLENCDIVNWWEAGFYDLVWENHNMLSNEKNVMQILRILCLVVADPSLKETRKKMFRLFNAMFNQLPVLLQESIVISASSFDSSTKFESNDTVQSEGRRSIEGKKGHSIRPYDLSSVLSGIALIKELTPVLNRLTEANANKLVTPILYLCLFDTNAIMRAVLQVAIENGGQIESVVRVLEQMSTLCHVEEPDQRCCKLISCLVAVLKGMEINAQMIPSIVKFFAALTTTHFQENSKQQKAVETPQLLAHSEVLKYFILPSLEDYSNKAPGTGQRQEENKITQDEHASGIPSANTIKNDKNTESQARLKEVKTETLLPLDIALYVLADMVKEMTSSSVCLIKAIPLLMKLAHMCVTNHVVPEWPNVAFENVRVREATKKCLFCLMECVKKHSLVFSEAEFSWLQHEAASRGLLEIALLKPLMSPLCDQALHGGIAVLTSQIAERKGHYWLAVAQLFQLSVAHPEMSYFVAQDLELVQLQIDQYGVDLGLFHVLVQSLPSEMRDLGPALLALARGQQKPWFSEDEIILLRGMSSMLNRDVFHSIQACEMLTCSVLRWTRLVGEATMCHILVNYREAFKSIFGCVVSGSILCVVAIAQHCQLLSTLSDPEASILEMSTMLLLDRLKTIIRTKHMANQGIPPVLSQDVKREIDWAMMSVRGALLCVRSPRIKQVLFAQLASL